MRRNAVLLAALLPTLFLSFGCKKGPQSVAFSGEWIHRTENGLTGLTTEERVSVQTNGYKFLTVTHGPESSLTSLFDGERLASQYIFIPSSGPVTGADAEPPQVGPLQTEKPSQEKIASLRFWMQKPKGTKSQGQQVASRATDMYEDRQKRPDGEYRLQTWVDRETGVVLRTAALLFSSQVNALVMRETWECRVFNPGDVPEKALSMSYFL
jgi:hypothetical protein